uniref:Trafficking protein particle complex subunit 13 n=1 Tax=Ornithodoros turicata TaxID=34597 RepID=A0A2R5L579_9ACAR
MEHKDTKEHFLALKVMRLTRPSLFSTLPIVCDTRDIPGSMWLHDLKQDLGAPLGLELFSSGNFLMLPQSFGNIYLGETFSCYMSVHNDSKQPVNDVSVKAELQTGTQKVLLTGRGDESTITELKQNDSVDEVIHHEVKEIGMHILVCTVSYVTQAGEKLYFRKFFKFQVFKPLDVKTKFYNAESDEVYLEAQLQNITSFPITLEKVSLEPSSHFEVCQMNTINENQSVFGHINFLNPHDSRQYLFSLSPRIIDPERKFKGGITTIGKLDIVWRSVMGERGRLQTSQLERIAPEYGDIRLTVDSVPSIVTLEEPFEMMCLVTNTCQRTVDLYLMLDNTVSPGILWQGLSGQNLGKLEPQCSLQINLEAVPFRTGLQTVSGIKLSDPFLKRTYDYDDITTVFVSSNVSKAC